MFNAFEFDYADYKAVKEDNSVSVERKGDLLVEAFMDHIDKSMANSWRVAPLIIKCWKPGLAVYYKCAECSKTTPSYGALRHHGCDKPE